MQRPRSVPVFAASAFFALEWLSNGFSGYGVFIDELYYLSCARRLAAGYVDHPPLSIWLLRAVLAFGDSLPWLRLAPALAGALSVYLAARLTRRLGGSAGAQALTALATAAAPVLLVLFGFYSMNALETPLVLALVSLVLELIEREEPLLWLPFGMIAGLALLNKHTAAVYVVALLTGLLLSPERRALRSRWLWIGAVAALLIVTPNLVWEQTHGWASLTFYRNATVLKNLPSPPWKVVADQLLSGNPLSLPVLLAGVYYGARVDRRVRFVVWAYLVLLALLALAGSSRPDRIGALLPALFALGARQLELLAAGRRWPLALAGVLSVCGACVLAPACLPLLPPRALGPYAQALGVVPKVERRGLASTVPQWFADRFAWDEVARAAERAAAQLTGEERGRAAVLGAFYAHSSACERFGKNLPRVIGRHNAWHDWGYPTPAPSVLILVGFDRTKAETVCSDLTLAATFTRPFSSDSDRPVFVCRRLRAPLPELWPRLRVLV